MMIKRNEVKWKDVGYLRIGQTFDYEYHLKLNQPLADWDVWDYWEHERTHSMANNLKKGDVLFDIGAEVGWLSVVYAQIVGAENMVLIEPTPEFWGNIHAIWHQNFDVEPLATCNCLFSEHTNQKIAPMTWEKAAKADLIDKLAYTYINDNKKNVPEITIDDYVKQSGIIPDALTIDTEGAEIAILRGAKETIKKHKPLVWVSVHPDLAISHGFGDTKNIYEFMESMGYKHKYLATDHEVHELFYPKLRKIK